jgi:hypothetical protein
MDKERFRWPILGVANEDGQIQYFQQTARTPQNAANADVMAISSKGHTYIHVTIYQFYCCQTNNLRRRINRVQSLPAPL